MDPLDEVMTVIRPPQQTRSGALTVLLVEMHKRGRAYWGWTPDEWMEILRPSSIEFHEQYRHTNRHTRHMLAAALYLLGLFDDFRKLGIIDRTALACRIFGRSRVQDVIQRVVDLIRSWGYGRYEAEEVQWAVCTVLLANKSPRLEDLTLEVLSAERSVTPISYRRASIVVLSRALTDLGVLSRPLERGLNRSPRGNARNGVDPEWVSWVDRWFQTCTIQENSRLKHYHMLLKAGRWITQVHPGCVSPDRWTRDLAAEWVGLACRMTIGEWTQIDEKYKSRAGQPLSAKAKAHHLASVSTFFRDIQEWGWIPRRFDPRRSFAAPKSLRALIGPKPRIIDDDVWAKLLWAGLNLEQSDLTTSHHGGHFYPLTMVKALTVVWLFCGLRVDEIWRLRVGCTRKQWNASPDAPEAVCDLDVPVNKTSQAFTKPVDQIVGESVRAWEAERPQQPPALDEKTGEVVHFLFMFRSKRIARAYINNTLVPILCRKAGLPGEDARGTITSHRARSTIASQLFNAKEPMSLFDLQRWLGHKWANSTQHYLDISPTKLARSFRDAGYFARNVRAIEVLIDREVVISGKAAHEPWKFYDLGHGYCAYDFFDQCPHRMACAKCGFYLAKGSSRAQLLEGKSNLLRMRQEIPLNDAELAAVDDGVTALQKLLDQLEDVATPAGPTPRELRSSELVQIAQGRPDGSSAA
jgi:integrase